MIKYGLISETDGRTIEKTIDLICDEFKDEIINVAEIGIYAGATGDGIHKYIHQKGKIGKLTGIDNFKDNEPFAFYFAYSKLLKGSSNEVYNQLEDNSQHLIFVDGDHSFIGVISDFFAYADKVKKGGYFCFHDTGAHIEKFKDFQHGDKNNPDAYISVRKALCRMGLGVSYKNESAMVHFGFKPDYWELIFDEADETNEAGGICCFRKLY